jgi:hypothetical protein
MISKEDIMAQMLMGAFRDKAQADRALTELEEQGYTPEEISVISQNQEYKDKGYDDTAGNVAKSAGSGAVTGGVVGGLAGLLAGAGVIPAIAGFFIGGPIAAALGLAGAAATTASGAVTGAAAGGLIGGLMGLGLSKETATSYDETVREGGVVIGLTGNEEITAESRAIMERCGAEDLNVIDMHDEATADNKSDISRSTADMDADGAVREGSDTGARRATASAAPAFGESRESFAEGSEDDVEGTGAGERAGERIDDARRNQSARDADVDDRV